MFVFLMHATFKWNVSKAPSWLDVITSISDGTRQSAKREIRRPASACERGWYFALLSQSLFPALRFALQSRVRTSRRNHGVAPPFLFLPRAGEGWVGGWSVGWSVGRGPWSGFKACFFDFFENIGNGNKRTCEYSRSPFLFSISNTFRF